MSAHSFGDPKAHLQDLFTEAVRLIAPDAVVPAIGLERPRQADHGDYACNLALQLAKQLKRNPRELGLALVEALPPSPFVQRAELAGAGFINVFLKPAAKQAVVVQILRLGPEYGKSTLGGARRVLLEFVSSNPTGPLHVGHGRGAAIGASLANILEAAGYRVHREYYVNDAGRQMDILTLSTWLRYLARCGIDVPFPPNAYQGDYVQTMAGQIQAAHGSRYVRDATALLRNVTAIDQDAEAHLDGLIANAKALLGDDYAYIHNFALTEQLGDCRNDLMEFGVHYDCWFSERSLLDSGMIEKVIARLKNAGHLYTQDGAKWFRSSSFGDEKNRVVQRENGAYTYFASDIAYHLNKFERGFDVIIDLWGSDHHGYIPRLRAALEALRLDVGKLHVPIVQFAVLYRNGKKVSMSTRAGEFVTLRELRQEVGKDAARFFYVLRKSDQHLDFDLDLAKSRSTENPVYYVQYAHARICSVLAKWGGDAADLHEADVAVLVTKYELDLLQELMDYPEVIAAAAQDYAPHLVAYFLKSLAARLHSYYNAEQILVADAHMRHARLALIAATRQVLRNALTLLGVSAPEQM
jgi:arginyl-tRNA synthetase